MDGVRGLLLTILGVVATAIVVVIAGGGGGWRHQ